MNPSAGIHHRLCPHYVSPGYHPAKIAEVYEFSEGGGRQLFLLDWEDQDKRHRVQPRMNIRSRQDDEDQATPPHVLDWVRRDITDRDLTQLLEVLPGNTEISEISLKGNRAVTDASADRLGSIIGPNRDHPRGLCGGTMSLCDVRKVNLDGTGMSPDKASWVTRQIDLRQRDLRGGHLERR